MLSFFHDFPIFCSGGLPQEGHFYLTLTCSNLIYSLVPEDLLTWLGSLLLTSPTPHSLPNEPALRSELDHNRISGTGYHPALPPS